MATYPSRYDAVSHGGHRPLQPQHQQQQQHHQQQSTTHQLAKTTTAVTLGGSLMVLSGVTLAGTVIGLVLLTPLLVIFSPVLIPAAFTLFLVTAGLVTSGGQGATASFVFYWMYKYATGKHPIGADKLDYARDQLTHAARDVKDKAEYYGHQTAQQIKGSPDRDT